MLIIKGSRDISLVICLSALSLSCGKSRGGAGQAPPSPQVSVAQVLEKRVKDWDEFTGRLQAVETVEIRPRVSGYIDKVAYSVGPSITWVAFDLGRVRARISTARAQTDAGLSAYEGAVLGALEDTEGALISYGRSQSRRDALQIAAAASDKAAELAQKRFEGGLIDFLEVLDAERTAFSAELLLSQSRTDAATSLIAVYKALGAGWGALLPK